MKLKRYILSLFLVSLPLATTVQSQPAGTVVGWGANNVGQTNVPTGLTDVVQVAAGDGYALALRNDGTIVAWGANFAGQLNIPSGLTDVVQVAAGGSHALALRNGGTVVAWGANTEGQANVPPGLTDVVQIAAGQFHSLALRNDGTVVTWGNNAFGQSSVPTGLTDVVQIAAHSNHNLALRANGTVIAWGFQPTGGVPGDLTHVVQIATGSEHAIALRDDGTVVAWGSNFSGQLNIPTGLPEVVQIATGNFHSLALLNSHTVIGWDNNFGSPTNSPTNVPMGLVNVVQVAAGSDFSLAIVGDAIPPLPIGTVVAWGANNLGQINVPSGLTDIVQVAAGDSYALALRNDGTIVGWGANFAGQLNIPTGLTNVVQVAAGSSHALALHGDGTVVAWGANTEGQANVPPGLTNVTQVAAGAYHSIALRDDGTVVGWGHNVFGQISVPTGLTDVVQIAAHSYHNLALRNDGTVIGWGYQPTEMVVPGDLTNVVQVATGSEHSLALRDNGTIIAWGHHLSGAINIPTGLPEVMQIAAGSSHSLALLNSHTVIEWSNSNVPIGLVNVVQVAAGSDFSLAIVGDEDPGSYVHQIGATDEGPGWRMLSSLTLGATLQDLANANLVYGIPGEYPNTDGTNPYVGYDGETFVAPSGLNHLLVPGKGFIWYLWDTAYDDGHTPPTGVGSSSHLQMPFHITFTGSPVVENHQVTFTEADRTDQTDDGFYLIGNPYTEAYNVRGIVPSTGAYSMTYHHWDAATNAYLQFNGLADDEVPVAAGFFMQFGQLPQLPVTITFGPPGSGPPTPPRDAVELFMAGFELTGDLLVEYEGTQVPVEIGDRNARVVFSEDATDGFDFLDAGKLNPLSYYWANIVLMGIQGDEMVRRSVESRPLPLEAVTIPMALSTYANGLNAGGAFTISLTDNALGNGWQVHLTDLETGEVVNMLTDSHTFTIETQPAIDADQRFEIVFTPPTVSGEAGGETYVFGLEAVWPNPTISTAQVAFTLEVAGEISLEVFDVLGRRVAQVANGEYAAGRHVLPMNTNSLASGVYVVRLTAGTQVAVQRVTVAR